MKKEEAASKDETASSCGLLHAPHSQLSILPALPLNLQNNNARIVSSILED